MEGLVVLGVAVLVLAALQYLVRIMKAALKGEPPAMTEEQLDKKYGKSHTTNQD